MRPAGDVVTDDVIRSLTISQRLLGTTEVLVARTRALPLLPHTGAVRGFVHPVDAGVLR